MPDYLRHADRIEAEIEEGVLRPGRKLPPVRRYAYENGIAVSTAARAYAELVRRALVSGEVGRGTYVRERSAAPVLGEPGRAPVIDLEFNATGVGPHDMGALAAAMARVGSGERLLAAAATASVHGPAGLAEALAIHLSRGPWTPHPEHLLFAGGGRHAIAGAMAAFAERTAPIGLEAVTYPMAKSIARRLGLRAVPLDMDEEGVRPEAIAEAGASAGIRLAYLQPTLQNPLGMTMGPARREAIAAVLERHDVLLIEDAVYGFLDPAAPPPIAALAPDRVVLVDSFSKRGFAGVGAGFLCVASPVLRARLAASIRAGAWLASPLGLALLATMLEDGVLPGIEAGRRAGAGERQRIVRQRLAGRLVEGGPHACHLWLRLPPPWRAETFGLAALRAGVAVTPAANFCVQPGHAPDAVRLAFATPTLAQLEVAVDRLARLLDLGPDHDFGGD